MDKAAKTPVPNHVHGRVTDINFRLKDIRNQFNRVLDRLRPLPEESANDEGEQKPRSISHSVQCKLMDTSDYIHDLENIAVEFEQYVGAADEDVPRQIARIG